MIAGKVTKLVTTFGSTWGRVSPSGEHREVFFNADSLARWQDFARLKVGQLVEFLETSDHVNGSHATGMVICPPRRSGLIRRRKEMR